MAHLGFMKNSQKCIHMEYANRHKNDENEGSSIDHGELSNDSRSRNG